MKIIIIKMEIIIYKKAMDKWLKIWNINSIKLKKLMMVNFQMKMEIKKRKDLQLQQTFKSMSKNKKLSQIIFRSKSMNMLLYKQMLEESEIQLKKTSLDYNLRYSLIKLFKILLQRILI